MSDSALLDTGVIFGYCVPLDQHHIPCDEYVRSNDYALYTTPTVESEFQRMKKSRIQELSTEILEHVRSLKQADLNDSLGPMDIDFIKKRLLDRNKDSYQFLYWYYDEEVGSFAQQNELIKDLREFARDIETVAIQRKQDLNSLVEEWTQQEKHKEVISCLAMIHREDRQICIEAHDLACCTDGKTEFATVNPQDFIDDGREEAILETTEIDTIQNLVIRN